MIRRFTVAAAACIIVAVLALAGAAPAAAHAARIAADPAPDAVLDHSPQRVSATFNEELQPDFAAMTVVGPDGNLWSVKPPTVSGAVASVDLRPLGPAGIYTVNYRVTSTDGHVVSGSWSFSLTIAGPGPPGPPVTAPVGEPVAAPAGAPDDTGIPVWPFAALAVAVVGGAAWWAVRRRA